MATGKFLDDLDKVCASKAQRLLPASFFRDLDVAHSSLAASAPRISVAELAELATTLDALRGRYREKLRGLLEGVAEDDPIRCPVSLFGTMDYGRLETAHTRVLAWLLNPRGEHGFGSRLLEGLLEHAVRGASLEVGDVGVVFDGLDAESASRSDAATLRGVRVTHVESVQSECGVECDVDEESAGRLDVLAEGRWLREGCESAWRMVIEAKIDAGEGDEQLARYDAWLSERGGDVVRVFLTPDGRAPETGADAAWKRMRFLDLAEVFWAAASSESAIRDAPGYHFLRYYLAGVLRDVCRVSVDVSSESSNPYAAVEYLRMVRRMKTRGGQ